MSRGIDGAALHNFEGTTLITEPSDDVREELIATSFNGDLMVLNLRDNGVGVTVDETPLFHNVVDGALGVNNAIHVIGTGSSAKIFASSSFGVRKFSIILGGGQ